MKLVTFIENSISRIGILKDDGVIDLSRAAPDLATDMLTFLEGGDAAMEKAAGVADSDIHYAANEIQLECPISKPPMILAIGLNYRAHAEETGSKLPEVPLVFTKQQTCANGPFDDIYAPPESKLLDYEGELGVVIGKRCRRVRRENAEDVIAGYCIVNDVSIRDWQARGAPASFTMGKSWDTHGPMGPSIVTRDEAGDPHQHQLKTWVNGELRQNSNTSDLIFDCFDLIQFISTAFTLVPGTIISTGTPSGVAAAMKPPAWLVPGDIVRIEIDKLGHIENKIIAEPV
ncbi:MAG: fumarylacetoacetate hydrolase family protein [Gammaproteobacteria bacterium]|nr:fumarylacetoacetate hydrolase family protein [Gammaproteobacteria bacterium]